MKAVSQRVVLKSKSSNTHIRNLNKNKKSWSSGEVSTSTPLVSKKRGVYVEKKTSEKKPADGKGSSNKAEDQQQPPRRGRKQFLGSVLTILSQETETTQFPEPDAPKPKKIRIRRRNVLTTDTSTQDLDAAYSREQSPDRLKERRDALALPPHRFNTRMFSKSIQIQNDGKVKQRAEKVKSVEVRKSKFRSKILNHNPSEKLVVLKESKHINVSKNQSQTSCTKADLKSNDVTKKRVLVVDEHKDIVIPVEKEGNKMEKTILESRSWETKTLVNKISSSTTRCADENAEHGEDKKLYKFFVNLLETTLSTYETRGESKLGFEGNEKDNLYHPKASNQFGPLTEQDDTKLLGDMVSEKILEVAIDEALGKTIRNEDDDWQPTVKARKPKKLVVIDVDDEDFREEPSDNIYDDNVAAYPPSPNRRRQFGANELRPPKRPNMRFRANLSYNYIAPRKPILKRDTKMYSFVDRAQDKPKKKKRKYTLKERDRRNPLLNMLIRELESDVRTYEEPATMHEALQAIARDQKRTRISLRQSDYSTLDDFDRYDRDKSECLLRSKRSVLSRQRRKGGAKKTASILKSIRSDVTPHRISIPAKPMASYNADVLEDYDFIYDENFSNHSIKVQGFDYEETPTHKSSTVVKFLDEGDADESTFSKSIESFVPAPNYNSAEITNYTYDNIAGKESNISRNINDLFDYNRSFDGTVSSRDLVINKYILDQ